MPHTDEEVRRSARLLSGFMAADVATGFAASLVLDQPKFLAAWQQQLASLPSPLPPALPTPQVQPLPPAAAAHVAAVKANPLFAQTYPPNIEFKMVELGKLIACQYWVDCHVSGGVHGAGMAAQPSADELLNTCLPPAVIPPAHIFTQRGPNVLIAYSMNNTLNVQGPGFDPATGRITFALGAGANLMLVREHAGRFILTNGYHRAWLLKSKGVVMVPAVVSQAATQDEVALGSDFIPPSVLFGPRPPTIDDFFDGTLSMDVEVRAILKAVKITAEMLIVPRLL